MAATTAWCWRQVAPGVHLVTNLVTWGLIIGIHREVCSNLNLWSSLELAPNDEGVAYPHTPAEMCGSQVHPLIQVLMKQGSLHVVRPFWIVPHLSICHSWGAIATFQTPKCGTRRIRNKHESHALESLEGYLVVILDSGSGSSTSSIGQFDLQTIICSNVQSRLEARAGHGTLWSISVYQCFQTSLASLHIRRLWHLPL